MTQQGKFEFYLPAKNPSTIGIQSIFSLLAGLEKQKSHPNISLIWRISFGLILATENTQGQVERDAPMWKTKWRNPPPPPHQKKLLHEIKRRARERDMSQFVRYSLLQTGILGGLKELGCGCCCCCWLLLHVVAVPWRIHHRTVRLLIAGFVHRWFDRPIVLVGEPFFVDLQRINHPVLVEWDDKLSLQQFRRVIIRSGLDQKHQKTF